MELPASRRFRIPRFSDWARPDTPFSWRKAVRREYKRIFGVVGIMTVFEFVSDFVDEGVIEFDPFWVTLFLLGLTFYLTVLFLKRKTRLLDVEREREAPPAPN